MITVILLSPITKYMNDLIPIKSVSYTQYKKAVKLETSKYIITCMFESFDIELWADNDHTPVTTIELSKN